jgi:L-fuconolactonase
MTTQQKRVYTKEPAIDPDLSICDPHHHLWERPGNRYFPEDLVRDTGSGHNTVKTVFLECRAFYRQEGPQEMKPVGETEFVQKVAVESEAGKYGPIRIAAGIVGHANLALGKAVQPVLEAQIEAGKDHFRGIRHSVVWDPHPNIPSYMEQPKGLLLDATFREGFSYLRKYDLSFDAWLYFHQMMELVDLAKAFPDTTIILNHIGGIMLTGPYAARREEVLQEWKNGIAALAGCPNVVVKVGGLGMTRCGFDWYERPTTPGSEEMAKSMKPYYLYCIEQFGVDRCMFESNFPVDKLSYSYSALWNAFKRITADFSAQDKSALFHDTAVQVYRL